MYVLNVKKNGRRHDNFFSLQRDPVLLTLKVSSGKEVPPTDVSELHRLQFNIFRHHSDVFWPVRHQQDGYNLNSSSTVRQQPQMVVFGSLGAMCLEGPAHILAI